LFNLNEKLTTARENFKLDRRTTQQTSNSGVYDREEAGLFDDLHNTLSRHQCLWRDPNPIDALQGEHRHTKSNKLNSV